MPISGLHGYNVAERVDKSVCDWYDGPTLFQLLDDSPLPERDACECLGVLAASLLPLLHPARPSVPLVPHRTKSPSRPVHPHGTMYQGANKA